MSGRRVSNSQPIAWKAIALPIELLPLEQFAVSSLQFRVTTNCKLETANSKLFRGQEWIRTTEVERQRIYSPLHLAALEPARK